VHGLPPLPEHDDRVDAPAPVPETCAATIVTLPAVPSPLEGGVAPTSASAGGSPARKTASSKRSARQGRAPPLTNAEKQRNHRNREKKKKKAMSQRNAYLEDRVEKLEAHVAKLKADGAKREAHVAKLEVELGALRERVQVDNEIGLALRMGEHLNLRD